METITNKETEVRYINTCLAYWMSPVLSCRGEEEVEREVVERQVVYRKVVYRKVVERKFVKRKVLVMWE